MSTLSDPMPAHNPAYLICASTRSLSPKSSNCASRCIEAELKVLQRVMAHSACADSRRRMVQALIDAR